MNDRPSYGDAEAKQIIERATEIEREQGQRLDARALREIGTEAGISPSAVERAIEEHESAAPPKEPWLKRHRAAIITAVIIAAVVVVYSLLRQAGPLSP
jgi:hypothetical protein